MDDLGPSERRDTSVHEILKRIDEGLQLNSRVHDVQLSLAKLDAFMRSETAIVHKEVEGLCKCVYGNGQPGLKGAVDRLEQNALSRKKTDAWMLGILGTVVATLAVQIVMWFVTHYTKGT